MATDDPQRSQDTFCSQDSSRNAAGTLLPMERYQNLKYVHFFYFFLSIECFPLHGIQVENLLRFVKMVK